jgi:hypothetical protein
MNESLLDRLSPAAPSRAVPHFYSEAPQPHGRGGSVVAHPPTAARAETSTLQVYMAERTRESRLAAPLATNNRPTAEFVRAQRVARGEADANDAEWLSKGFAAFLASGGAVPLERCLRLPRNDSALRRACRNYWLCRAWEALDDQASPWRRSEKLATIVREFKSRQWPRWRALEQPPATASEVDAALFHAFRSHDRVPFTAMQLHNIASNPRDA